MFLPINPEDLPEGMLQAMQDQARQAEMETEGFHNSVYHLFDELNTDQLVTLNRMLHIIAQSSSSMLAAYYEGQVQSVLKYKHNVCPVHGVDHSQEVLDQNQPDEKSEAQAEGMTPQERAINMSLFNLQEIINPETNLPQYRCVGCGTLYPSLEDRMLKGQDECQGCIHKAQWG